MAKLHSLTAYLRKIAPPPRARRGKFVPKPRTT